MTAETVGVMGVGHLTSHLVPGLLRSEAPPAIILSPRNQETAGRLSDEYGLAIAADNRELVERSDMVLLGVRPFDASDAVRGLPWRESQIMVSLCAGVTLAELAPLVAPALVVRAMPVIAAEFGHSPTCHFPDEPRVRALFERCGTAIALRAEAEFDVATSMACHASALIMLVDNMAAWNERVGLAPDTARSLAALSMRAAAETVLGRPETPISDLVEELTLPGSATRAGVERLRAQDACAAWVRANDVTLKHVRSRQKRPKT